MEAELRAYRSNPTNTRFNRLYYTARPWLKNVAISTLNRYSSLSLTGSLDDVVIEGAFALSVSARRFVFLCPVCGRAFVDRADMARHMRVDHRRRGVGLVSLASFSKTSAALAMRRTTRRLARPEILDPDAADKIGVLEDAEDRMIVEILIGRLRDRLSARVRANLELVLRESIRVDPIVLEDLRREAMYITVTRRRTRKERKMSDYTPEPNWTALNVRTLREAAKDVLGIKTSKRTMRTAYADIHGRLKGGVRELEFTCVNCNSLIDDKMPRCWACGLIFNEESEDEPVVDAELVERAKKIGVDPEGKSREDLLEAIEEVETRTRKARQDVDLLTIESARLNEQLTEAMPDGWSKKISKQYTSYFDGDRTRRIAIYHRGLRVQFSVDDGFLDGFAELEFFDADQRRAKHFGRVNYVYNGDTAKYAFDLVKRVFDAHGA